MLARYVWSGDALNGKQVNSCGCSFDIITKNLVERVDGSKYQNTKLYAAWQHYI